MDASGQQTFSIQTDSVVARSPSARLVERHFPDKVPSRQNGKPGQRNCVVCSSKAGKQPHTAVNNHILL